MWSSPPPTLSAPTPTDDEARAVALKLHSYICREPVKPEGGPGLEEVQKMPVRDIPMFFREFEGSQYVVEFGGIDAFLEFNKELFFATFVIDDVWYIGTKKIKKAP